MRFSFLSLPVWAHAGGAALVFAGFQAVKSLLDQAYVASRHPVDYATGQLAFDAGKVEGYYATMQAAGTLDIYWRTQFIDFGFLLAIGLLALFWGTLVARLSRPGQWGHRFGFAAAGLGIAGATFDALENLTSFVLLSNPTQISQFWATVYSSFAAAKFAMISSAMLAMLLALIFGIISRLRQPTGIGH